MPELPEIEVLRRSLVRILPGRRIERIRVREPRLREPIEAQRLVTEGTGRRIERLRRRAKYLLLDLSGELTLAVHLGMSGRLVLGPKEAPWAKHEHLRLELDGGQRLAFRDPRRFGLILLLATAAVESDRHFVHLGLEPLSAEFSAATLERAAERRRGPVKALLMDSRVVVGIGNIYASEALYRAGIHPRRSVSRIAGARWQRLVEAIREALLAAIEDGGTTLSDWSDGRGEPGRFQTRLAVYDRAGRPCLRCRRAIRRIVQAGRSTFYCPGCQR